ncbi:glycoside hydrolase superfamily [Amanita rubescens]|nr:glycoside hydrolase superfamily [Amanita rubescens]
MDEITSFYLEAYDMIRNITGLGEGNRTRFLQGSDRVMLDKHSYFSFGGSQPQPLNIAGANGYLGGQWPITACSAWGGPTNASRSSFGVTFVGEFAASPNDCGLFLHGVNSQPQTPNCSLYDNWPTYTSDMTQGILNFVMTSMDAFGDWMFWTWKLVQDNYL